MHLREAKQAGTLAVTESSKYSLDDTPHRPYSSLSPVQICFVPHRTKSMRMRIVLNRRPTCSRISRRIKRLVDHSNYLHTETDGRIHFFVDFRNLNGMAVKVFLSITMRREMNQLVGITANLFKTLRIQRLLANRYSDRKLSKDVFRFPLRYL